MIAGMSACRAYTVVAAIRARIRAEKGSKKAAVQAASTEAANTKR